MAEQTIQERLEALKQKRDHVGDLFGAADLQTLIEGIEYAMSHGGDVSVAVTPVENGYKITVTDSEGNVQEATVQNGGDAYEVYKSTVPEGQTPMNKTEWLASLKGEKGDNGHNPCIGRFRSYSELPTTGVQNGDYAYVDTISNGVVTATKVYHYTTEWEAEADGVDVTGSNTAFNSGQNIADTPIKDQNGNIAQTAQGVLSAEAGAALNEGKIDKVENIYDFVVNEPQSGYPKEGWLLASGAAYQTSSTAYEYILCEVVGNKEYYITGRTGTGTGNCLAVFLDSTSTVISSSILYAGEANKRISREKHVSPPNAAYIRIMGETATNETSYRPKCETYEIISSKNNQENLEKIGDVSALETTNKETIVDAINEVNGKISDVTEVQTSKNLFNKSEIIGDKIVKTSGIITTQSGWTYNKCTKPIPIEPNKYYCISGGTINGGGNIRCLASDGTTKMKVLNPSTGSEGSNYIMPGTSGLSINGQFLTPPTAAYVQFNIAANTIDSTNTIMLELVGDTYNPDFIPSDYEPYFEPHTVIKPEALPELDVKNELKVLLIGSSHGANTVSQLPFLLYKSGHKDIVVGNVYVGSFMLQELAQRIVANQTMSYQEFNSIDTVGWGKNRGSKTLDTILNRGWDVISLQRSHSDDNTWTTSQATSLEFIIKYISNYCKVNELKAPRIILNSGFADNNTSTPTYSSIISTAKQIKNEFGIDYYPTAMALANARNTWMVALGSQGNLRKDANHLDWGIGCWIASACLYEAVMRPLGESVAAVDGYGTYAEMQVFATNAGMGYDESTYTEPTQKTMEIAKSCVLAAFDDDTELNSVLAGKYQYQNQVEVFANFATVGGTDVNTKCVATGGSYSITFAVWSNATLSSVSVEMNGVDITSTAYDSANAAINISNVDGDIRVIIKTTH